MFSIEVNAFHFGSSDKAAYFIMVFIFLIFSLLVSVIWSFLEKNKAKYEKLNYWFFILLRYFLALTLLSYGLSKVFFTQFSEPSVRKLIQTFGQFTPMDLAWIFFGFSKGYQIFIGIGQITGALLLFSKKNIFARWVNTYNYNE